MAGAGLRYSDIAAAMKTARFGSITCYGLSSRMGKGATVLQRALDTMVAAGAVREFPGDGGRRYALTGLAVPDGEVVLLAAGCGGHKKAAGREVKNIWSAGEDDDIASRRDQSLEIEDSRITSENRRAEQLWKQRMGFERWRDDPRAVRERLSRELYSRSMMDRTYGGCVDYDRF
jgi:hypothetical protein